MASSCMSNLAKFCRRCQVRFDLYIGGVVVDFVLPVLVQRQAAAVLVSLQWRCLNFLDQLTEWERRIQEYEGESLETFFR